MSTITWVLIIVLGFVGIAVVAVLTWMQWYWYVVVEPDRASKDEVYAPTMFNRRGVRGICIVGIGTTVSFVALTYAFFFGDYLPGPLGSLLSQVFDAGSLGYFILCMVVAATLSLFVMLMLFFVVFVLLRFEL